MSELETPASGGGYDAQRRELKGRIAAATTAGDTGTVEELEGEMRKLDDDRAAEERKVAAAARREAGKTGAGDSETAKTAAPAARTTAPKLTTAKPDPKSGKE